MAKNPNYTTTEKEWLRNNYATAPREEILSRFPTRTWTGILQYAHKMKLSRNAGAAYNRVAPIVRPLSETELAYIAGIVDGEGHFSLIKSQKRQRGKVTWLYVPVMGITNQSEALIMWLSERIRFTIHTLEVDKTGFGWSYRPSVTGQGIAPLLEMLIPYLVTKRRQAKIIVEYCKLRASKSVQDRIGIQENALREEIMELNAKKKQPTNALSA